MSWSKTAFLIAFVFPLAGLSTTSLAQTAATGESSVLACPSQNELEQSIGSQGSITPEECTMLQVNSLSSDNGDLCLIDFGMDEGFLGRLRDAAFPTQWWVECDRLSAAARR